MSPANVDPVPKEGPHALLKEGAQSYLEALTALTIFRQQVQSVCQEVLGNSLEHYSTALGVPLKKRSIVPYATPEEQFNRSSATLGAKIKISSRKKSGLGC